MDFYQAPNRGPNNWAMFNYHRQPLPQPYQPQSPFPTTSFATPYRGPAAQESGSSSPSGYPHRSSSSTASVIRVPATPLREASLQSFSPMDNIPPSPIYSQEVHNQQGQNDRAGFAPQQILRPHNDLNAHQAAYSNSSREEYRYNMVNSPHSFIPNGNEVASRASPSSTAIVPTADTRKRSAPQPEPSGTHNAPKPEKKRGKTSKQPYDSIRPRASIRGVELESPEDEDATAAEALSTAPGMKFGRGLLSKVDFHSLAALQDDVAMSVACKPEGYYLADSGKMGLEWVSAYIIIHGKLLDGPSSSSTPFTTPQKRRREKEVSTAHHPATSIPLHMPPST
ncbi:hypothetical protein B9479_008344, partial [Cryptococcus floricola]